MKRCVSGLLVFDDQAIPTNGGDRQYVQLGIVQVVERAQYLGLVLVVEKELGAFREFVFGKKEID